MTTKPRRERSLVEKLGSILVPFQAISVFCAGLALFGLKALPAPVALGGTGGYLVLMVIAAYTLRFPWGKWFLLGLEIALTLLGLVHGSMWFVGGVFTALWIWCLVQGQKGDAQRAAMLAAHQRGAAQ